MIYLLAYPQPVTVSRGRDRPSLFLHGVFSFFIIFFFNLKFINGYFFRDAIHQYPVITAMIIDPVDEIIVAKRHFIFFFLFIFQDLIFEICAQWRFWSLLATVLGTCILDSVNL